MRTLEGSLAGALKPSKLAIARMCGTAYAQDAAPSGIEEVTATGTRIRRTDGMAGPTPVTTLSPQALQLFEPGGTIAEQLDNLPQFFAAGTAQRGGPALFDENPLIIPASSTRFGAQIVDDADDVWGRRFQVGFNLDL
jgi:hypothetical protein